MKEIIEKYSYLDYINCLDTSTKSVILELDKAGISFDVVGKEIAKQPTFGMSTKGASNWDPNLFEKILIEVAKIICVEGDTTKNLKDKLISEGQLTSNVIIAITADCVGDILGLAGALCVPFVILAFAVFLKAGFNVFCTNYNK